MSQPNPELLILAVALIALCLAPVASRLVARIGEQISSELDGGRSGEALHAHLDSSYEGAERDDEIAQMLEASAYIRGVSTTDAPVARDDGLEEEVRQIVIASNERRARAGKPPLDVESEVVRRLAEALGANGHPRA